MQVLVEVCRLDGESLKLHLEQSAQLSSIQTAITHAWRIPQICQMLILGEDCLKDMTSTVADFLPDRTSTYLAFSIVLSFETVREDLSSGDLSRQLQGFDCLGQIPSHGSGAATDILVEYADHENSEIRCAVLKAFVQIVEVSDSSVIKKAVDSALVRLEDHAHSVRKLAVQLLERIAKPGSEGVIVHVSAMLAHQQSGVRQSAMQALRAIGSSDLTFMIEALEPYLKHDLGSIRKVAVQACSGTAKVGDERIPDIILPYTADNDANVRRAAIESLSKFVPQGDERFIANLSTCLNDEDVSVRVAVVKALPGSYENGDARLMDRLSHLLHDKDSLVRRAVAKSLAHVCEKSDELVTLLGEALVDHDDAVRCAAIESLPKMFELDKAVLVPLCIQNLNDRNPEVRRAALKAFVGSMDKSNSCHIATLVACLDDDTLRKFGQQSLLQVLEKGSGLAVAPLLEHVRHSDASIRCAALQVLSHAAKRDDEQIIAAVAACFRDENAEVRNQAHMTMCDIAETDSRCAAALLIPMLQDGRTEVRNCASTALLKMGRNVKKSLIGAVMSCASHDEPSIRQDALRMLPEVAEKGDVFVEAQVTSLLLHRDDQIVRVALQMIPIACARNRQSLADQVRSLLRAHPSASTIHDAVPALFYLKREHNGDLADAILDVLEHTIAPVRKRALEILPTVVDWSDGRMVCVRTCVMEKLKDSDANIRRAAIEACTSACGNEIIINALFACLDDTHAAVQCAAFTTLFEILPPTDDRRANLINSCLVPAPGLAIEDESGIVLQVDEGGQGYSCSVQPGWQLSEVDGRDLSQGCGVRVVQRCANVMFPVASRCCFCWLTAHPRDNLFEQRSQRCVRLRNDGSWTTVKGAALKACCKGKIARKISSASLIRCLKEDRELHLPHVKTHVSQIRHLAARAIKCKINALREGGSDCSSELHELCTLLRGTNVLPRLRRTSFGALRDFERSFIFANTGYDDEGELMADLAFEYGA